jgi:hypothetical protein
LKRTEFDRKANNPLGRKVLVQKSELEIDFTTASLGNWFAIENKTHHVHGGLSESTESPEKSNIGFSLVLTRQNGPKHVVVLHAIKGFHSISAQKIKFETSGKQIPDSCV